ncbi:MAG: hypothetical protein QXJ62_03135 [Nitrososphaeria archaeon]
MEYLLVVFFIFLPIISAITDYIDRGDAWMVARYIVPVALMAEIIVLFRVIVL